MCGIAGILNFSGEAVSRDTLQAMNEAQKHRGPDGEGVYADGPVGLGHRRLAIIDLTDAARQPMANSDGSILIT